MDLRHAAQDIASHSGSSPISSVSTEILEAIFDLIYDSPPLTITSLTLVNRAFYDSARFFRDRQQTFHLEDTDGNGSTDFSSISAARLEALLSSPLPNTRTLRHITISSPAIRKDHQTLPNLRDMLEFSTAPTDVVSNELKFKPISQLISRAPKLRSFTFEAYEQIPLCIIEALQTNHPNAELHIKNWTRTSQYEGHNNPAELALSKCSNLRSIEVDLGNNAEAGIDLRGPAFKRIVALAPNLTTVNFAHMSTAFGLPTTNSGFELYYEQRQCAKAFEVTNPASNSVRRLKSRSDDDVDFLEDVTSLDKIESLEIERVPTGDFFLNSNHENRFPSLKSLSITSKARRGLSRRANGAALTNFLMSVQPLRSLQFSCCAHLLPAYNTFLFHHGSALRTLIVHEAEMPEGRGDKAAIEVEQIRRTCPLLTEVSIDIDSSTDGAEEFDIFCQLAKLPYLTTLRIHFGLTRNQLITKNPFHRGYLGQTPENSSWIENVWSVLREHKAKREAVALQQLIITMGEVERKVPLRQKLEMWAKWVAENKLQIVATPSERDDGANEIVVITKIKDECPVRTRRQLPTGPYLREILCLN